MVDKNHNNSTKYCVNCGDSIEIDGVEKNVCDDCRFSGVVLNYCTDCGNMIRDNDGMRCRYCDDSKLDIKTYNPDDSCPECGGNVYLYSYVGGSKFICDECDEELDIKSSGEFCKSEDNETWESEEDEDPMFPGLNDLISSEDDEPDRLVVDIDVDEITLVSDEPRGTDKNETHKLYDTDDGKVVGSFEHKLDKDDELTIRGLECTMIDVVWSTDDERAMYVFLPDKSARYDYTDEVDVYVNDGVILEPVDEIDEMLSEGSRFE